MEKKINAPCLPNHQIMECFHYVDQFIFPYVDENKNPLIIKQISEIKFNHLTHLSLWTNKIVSIEQLSRVWMPKLKVFGLSMYRKKVDENDLCFITDLKKSYWPILKSIGLSTRRIKQQKTK